MECFRCHKTPSELQEYIDYAEGEDITPEEYVRQSEGTYNPENGHFCCTPCYIAIGMPSTLRGWKAP